MKQRETISKETSSLRPSWLVFVAILLIAANLRTAVMSFVPILGAIRTDLGFPDVAVGAIATIPTLVFGLVAIAGPALFRIAGGEILLALSSGTIFIGILLRSFAADVWQLGLTFTFATVGIGIANVVLIPVSKQYYSHRLGFMNALYLGVLQIGPIIAPVLVSFWINDGVSWRLATGVWCIPALLSLIVWCAQWWVRKRDVKDAQEVNVQPPERISFLQLIHSPLAWGITGLFAATSMLAYTLQAVVPQRLISAGVPAANASSLVSIFWLLGMVGSFVAPVLLTRMRRPYLLVLGLTLFSLIGLLGLIIWPAQLAVLWITFIGIGLNNFAVALTLMNMRSRTSAGAAGLSGFGQGIGYLLASTGPFGIGLVKSLSQGWEVPLIVMLVSVPVSLWCGWIATRERLLEDTLPGVSAHA